MKPCIVIVLDTLFKPALTLSKFCVEYGTLHRLVVHSSSMHHDPFLLDLHCMHAVVFSPNAGAILTSAEFCICIFVL